MIPENSNEGTDGGLPTTTCSALAAMKKQAQYSKSIAEISGHKTHIAYENGFLDAIRELNKIIGWRDPESDPPTSTGKILVWRTGVGPAIVNVEERWMCFWDGHDETEVTGPSEWDRWCEISPPNVKVRDRSGSGTPPQNQPS